MILVGRDSAFYLEQALRSLPAADWGQHTYEIIYVDNGSKDRTRTMLQDDFPGVQTILNAGNLGFCKAANQGAGIANSRYLFFLNDDTIVLDAAIRRLAEFLDQADEASVVGSRLLYPDGSEQYSGRTFPTLLNGIFGRRSALSRLFPNAKAVRRYLFKDQLAGDAPFEVDWVSAAAMMIRSEVFLKLGGFAEDYYYFHECVISDRLQRAGYKTYLHPDSRIIHYEGFGSGPGHSVFKNGTLWTSIAARSGFTASTKTCHYLAFEEYSLQRSCRPAQPSCCSERLSPPLG